MKLILTTMSPSPEQELITESLKSLGEISSVYPWNPESHTALYDIAVCVGPVNFCPLAKKKVLFVFGQTKHHLVLDWDAVVVTSEKAKKLSLHRFGYGTRIRVIPPFLSGLHIAQRRLVTPKKQFLHVSEGGISLREDIGVMTLWGDLGFDWQKPDQIGEPALPPRMFSLLEFNSRVKAGAIGYYPSYMEDGYDVQVRRHLVLGGTVICRRDKEVLGDLTDFCCDQYDEKASKNINLVECVGNESDYREQILNLMKRV